MHPCAYPSLYAPTPVTPYLYPLLYLPISMGAVGHPNFSKNFQKNFHFPKYTTSNFHSSPSTDYYIISPILNDPHLYFLQRLIQKNFQKNFHFPKYTTSNFHSSPSTDYYIISPILNDPHLYFLQRLIQKNFQKNFHFCKITPIIILFYQFNDFITFYFTIFNAEWKSLITTSSLYST